MLPPTYLFDMPVCKNPIDAKVGGLRQQAQENHPLQFLFISQANWRIQPCMVDLVGELAVNNETFLDFKVLRYVRVFAGWLAGWLVAGRLAG